MRYRMCQRTLHERVGVFRSLIHGLGLYCVQEMEPGEMVIEYAGTVIRSILTDMREKFYDSKVSFYCFFLGWGRARVSARLKRRCTNFIGVM